MLLRFNFLSYVAIIIISAFMYLSPHNLLYSRQNSIESFNPKVDLLYKKKIRVGICHEVDILSASFVDNCQGNSQGIVLWGDSYAASLYPGLEKYFHKNEVTQLTNFNSPPLFINDRKADNGRILVDINNDKLNLAVKLKPKVIIFSWMMNGKNGGDYNWNLKILETIKEVKIKLPNVKIVIIGPYPTWQPSLIKILKNMDLIR